MEIEYSNFALDVNTFGKNEVCGLIDKNSNFIYNRVYDIKKLEYSQRFKTRAFLAIDKLRKKDLLKNLKDEFEITSEIESKTLKQLSSSELLKVLILKVALGSSKVMILDHIDDYFNDRDLSNVLKGLKKYAKEIGKTIIFSTNKVDNIINNCDRYIIASENRVIYNGNNLDTLPVKTQIAEFVDAANKKKAKLVYYKDENDLLKAIYRSVKK